MDDHTINAACADTPSDISLSPDFMDTGPAWRLLQPACHAIICAHHHAGLYRCAIGAMLVAPILLSSAFGADESAGQAVTQWPGYWSHLIALALITLSFITTAALNTAKRDIRIIGTLLGALGCFGIFGFYLWAWFEGVITNPRPIYKPTDHLKPALFTLIAAIAAAAGLFLLLVAHWQKKAMRGPSPATEDRPEQYNKIARYLHWMTASLFLAMIPIGIFMSMIPSGTAYRYTFYGIHKTIGVSILFLVIIRILWNFRYKRPPLEASLSAWERRLASTAHFALYVIMLGFPLSGYIMSTFAGHPTGFFLWELPMLLPENRDAAVPFGIAHTIILPYLVFIVFGAHILGGLKHRFLDDKKSFYRRMLS